MATYRSSIYTAFQQQTFRIKEQLHWVQNPQKFFLQFLKIIIIITLLFNKSPLECTAHKRIHPVVSATSLCPLLATGTHMPFPLARHSKHPADSARAPCRPTPPHPASLLMSANRLFHYAALRHVEQGAGEPKHHTCILYCQGKAGRRAAFESTPPTAGCDHIYATAPYRMTS